MPLESRRIASLLLTNPDKATWVKAIENENILQKDAKGTAVRQANLIRKRLMLLDAEGWKLIAESDSEITNQLLFVAAIKQSKLLVDFLKNVYVSCQKKMETQISFTNCEDFFIECAHHDPSVSEWNASTKTKILNGILRILVEAKYLVDFKTMQLSPRDLHPVVRRYLHERNDGYIIDCLERTT